MHESALCRRIVEQVCRLATAERARRVTRVRLRLGPLAGLLPEQLADMTRHATAGTIAAGAEIVVDLGQVLGVCRACRARSEVPAQALRCPVCDARALDLEGGDELLITDLEYER